MCNDCKLELRLAIIKSGEIKNTFINLKNSKINVIFTRNPPDVIEYRIYIFIKIYDCLCQSADIINKYYTKCILVVMGISFVSIVFNIFYILNELVWLLKNSPTIEDVSFLMFSLHQTFTSIVNIMCTVTMCNDCEIEAKKTTILINKMMIQEEDENIIRKLHHFSTYLLHRNPKFSACGFFPIDNTLYFTMVGAATTYLIILIQFTLSTPDTNKYASTGSGNSTIK
ncbi:putative gustatory receptor 28b [Arctopsyche grandis]|uniref:putative gustatory receptor 28b n=1 Tax=Arctopsyche grandis TaxID=121162 RepID=UPI00406D6CBE